MFGLGKKAREQRALEDAFRKIDRMLSDDDMQLRILGPHQYSTFKALSAIDKHRDPEGEFGRAIGNPIPTNGPIGSISYLSNLRSEGRHRLLFHRIGAIEKVDLYEYTSLGGENFGFLMIDMYHSRKSKICPDGFTFAGQTSQLTGFNHFWDDFPFGYAEQKAALPEDYRLLYASIETVAKEMDGRSFQAPDEHLLFKEALLGG